MVKRIGLGVAALVAFALSYTFFVWLGWMGEHEGPGVVTEKRVPRAVVDERAAVERAGAEAVGATGDKQVLFGDLHVHTTFSTDAFLWSLPMVQGDGAHPVADACDFARFCSGLDFWSINDHAEASTPQRWQETKETIRQCNAVAGDPENPDVAVFLGWEWSQVGQIPEEHYGHKNVLFRGLGEDEVPTRAIGAGGMATDALRGSFGGLNPLVGLLDFEHRQRYFNFAEFMKEVRDVPLCPEGVNSRELPADCYEQARTPRDLFEKLDQWGLETIVIPHGNTWGFYSPPGTTWDKQLREGMNDPEKQFLVEIMSGHGNSEEYRSWRDVGFDEYGGVFCPEPTDDYLPSCWRAGEIIQKRCIDAGLTPDECAARANEARQNYARYGIAGALSVPGVSFEEWLDAGQCKDCFIPSFNYRPGGSTQYALALTNFDDPANPKQFRFGIIASSDNHQGRPGTGYKEIHRIGNTEAGGPRDATWRGRLMGDPKPGEPRSTELDVEGLTELGFQALEAERQATFFMTGGLAAVHSTGRSRDAVWAALQRKEVYGTSGDRILLWFNLLNAPGEGGGETSVPMGSEVKLSAAPRFEVRALGALKQKPGCPPMSVGSLSKERLQYLCRGECYNPSDERKRITRIEVVRIRPQAKPGEPVAPLIQDPWKTFSCDDQGDGCVAQFEDAEFAGSGRGAAYYARAIEEPSMAVNGKNVRCTYDEKGRCREVDICYGDYRTPASDDCLSEIEERAWSSPIFVDPS
ncbi:MAG: DUF3604 domain-containing protein [Deltaproteobacteria bacterium]|nr:DUF3604 domain-containing protein [Deltaproteobacteria bacterium]